MRLFTILERRLSSLFSRQKVEQELDEELAYHLDRQIEENLRQGLPAEEARFAALRSIGGLEQRKEECRDARGWNLLDELGQDLRFSLRQLRKNPGFTVVAILMLGLGICASVAIFAFVDAALIRPLPYRDPARLVGVFESIPMFEYSNLSYQDFLDWQKRNTVFASFAAYQPGGVILSTPTGVQMARGLRVTDAFFRTLGVAPLLGRDFIAGEDRRTAILSYSTWQKRFGGRQEVLGSTLTLDGEPTLIIGVLPKDFQFAATSPSEFWLPVQPEGSCLKRRGCHNLYGVARLKDGISIETALSNVQAIASQLQQEYPQSNRDQGASLQPLSTHIVGTIRPTLLLLLTGAGLLLLIACINVASLLLVRSESRRREMAVRSAFGASSARLARQFLTEGIVLVSAGTAVGLAASYGAMQLLAGLIPEDHMARMSYLQGLSINGNVLAFTGVVACLAVFLFAITPALHLLWSRVRNGLSEGSRGSSGLAWRRLGSRLVVIELATAVVLLIGAGLLGKSFYLLLQVDVGMQPDHLATVQLATPVAKYSTVAKTTALSRELSAQLSALPGVSSVGFSTLLPVGSGGNTSWFRIIGRPFHGERNEMPNREVSPDYFKTIGARLAKGRFFLDSDDATKPKVVIVNRSMARLYFPNEDPIGKQISYHSDPVVPMEIVGLVEDIREGPLDKAIHPTVYIPIHQSQENYFAAVVRTGQSEKAILTTLTAAIRAFDPEIATIGAATMTDLINDSQPAYLHRASAWLVGVFAAMALLLGVVGLYGVIAYSVSQRTREIGVRMALGAPRATVYRMIFNEAGSLAVFGLLLGLLAAAALSRLLSGFLFGVSSWDLSTFAGVTLVLAAAATLASFLPAHRAASVNPVEAMRSE
ncbi:ABC transporter permease [Bryobacter aggregatus]|uniref:ABC transporter permease n=1 Tax=Bryobacter aggregatus TaxID=360054 RepID=UPI0004E1F4B5|nr:ABC transporter permease [Bryobacter aggregatus]